MTMTDPYTPTLDETLFETLPVEIPGRSPEDPDIPQHPDIEACEAGSTAGCYPNDGNESGRTGAGGPGSPEGA